MFFSYDAVIAEILPSGGNHFVRSMGLDVVFAGESANQVVRDVKRAAGGHGQNGPN
jgi:hypothetical protein